MYTAQIQLAASSPKSTQLPYREPTWETGGVFRQSPVIILVFDKTNPCNSLYKLLRRLTDGLNGDDGLTVQQYSFVVVEWCAVTDR